MLTVNNRTISCYTIRVSYEQKVDNYTKKQEVVICNPDVERVLEDAVCIKYTTISLSNYYKQDYMIRINNLHQVQNTIESVVIEIAEGSHGPLVTMNVDGIVLNPSKVKDITAESCVFEWLFCCPCMSIMSLYKSLQPADYKSVQF